MLIVTNRVRKAGAFGSKEAPDHHLYYANVDPEGGVAVRSPASFRRQLIDRLKGIAESHPRPIIVIPVHGFNTDWEEAVAFFCRIDTGLTAELAGAITIGFSWPSAGKGQSYVGDRARARSTGIALASALGDAMRLLESERCPAELVAVTHSMGNYVMAKAASYAAEARGLGQFHILSELLMVAADLDDDSLYEGNVAHSLVDLCRRVTVYRSVHDGALLASRAKRGSATGGRLGRQGPPRIEDLPRNVVVVDASDQTDVGGLAAHGEHFRNETVLADMRAVCRGIDRSAIKDRRPSDTKPGEYKLS